MGVYPRPHQQTAKGIQNGSLILLRDLFLETTEAPGRRSNPLLLHVVLSQISSICYKFTV